LPHLTQPLSPRRLPLGIGLAATLAMALLGCAAPEHGPTAGSAPPAPTASGALGNAAYIVPKGSPTARLVMRAKLQADEQYNVFVLDDALACKGAKRAGGGTPQQPATPALLAAGVLTTLDYVVIKAPQRVCLVRWTFTPEAGRSYLLDGVIAPAGCMAVLFDVSQPDQIRTAAGALRRNLPGQACAPLAQSLPAPRSPLEGGQSEGEAVLNPAATAADLEGLIAP